MCGECGAGFRQKRDLVRHISIKHEGVKYSCDQCEYQSLHQGHLKRHISRKHEDVRYSSHQFESDKNRATENTNK